MGMYDVVQRKEKQEGRWSLKVAGIVAACAIVAMAGLVLWAMKYQLNYREFISHFSSSKVYAVENFCFYGEVEGAGFQGKRKTPDRLYTYIALGGIGRVGKAPEGEPEIRLDFGDGGNMFIWNVEEGKQHCYILYQHEDGFSYGYYTSKVSVSTLKVSYLPISKNIPWEGSIPYEP